MIVKDLLGNEYNFKIIAKRNKKYRSKLHKQAIEVIRVVYPGITLAEEVPIKVKPGLNLYIDIYVPIFDIAVEVHGQQHFEFNQHFHKHPHRFGRYKLNDDLKKEWCELNNFTFIELPYNESREQWEHRIREAGGFNLGQLRTV